MIFNDAEGSVYIEDPSGNTWMMDGKGNISVNAPKNFTVNASDIIMNALKTVSVSAGTNITETAGMDYSISAGAMITQNVLS